MRSLVELHGGTVTAASEGSGKGSELTVRLPARVQRASAPPSAPEAPSNAPRETKHRILLVDAPRELRLERLVRERGLDESDAMAMIAAQMPAELKRARADFIIDNVGTVRELEERVSEVWTTLEREAHDRVEASAVS